MGTKTGISWTSATWNPIRGCSRVSEGCRNCYAESTAYRFSGKGQPYEGLAVLKNGHASWTGKVDWIDEHWEDPLRWGKSRKIFVNSMSDLFHENIPDRWIDDVFAVMQHSQAKGHIFQILTKRPKRMLEYLTNPDLYFRLMNRVNYVRGRWPKIPVTPFSDPKAFPLKNVWLGVSTEDQKTADERIPLLLQAPAAIRFISAEPLLGPIDLARIVIQESRIPGHVPPVSFNSLLGWNGGASRPYKCSLDWVIVGGESGPHARPMLSSWAGSIQEQCEAAGVAFFFKQNGEWIDAGHEEFGKLPTAQFTYINSHGVPWGKDVPLDEDSDVNTMKRVGKKRSGDTLYGKIYHEFPSV